MARMPVWSELLTIAGPASWTNPLPFPLDKLHFCATCSSRDLAVDTLGTQAGLIVPDYGVDCAGVRVTSPCPADVEHDNYSGHQ